MSSRSFGWIVWLALLLATLASAQPIPPAGRNAKQYDGTVQSFDAGSGRLVMVMRDGSTGNWTLAPEAKVLIVSTVVPRARIEATDRLRVWVTPDGVVQEVKIVAYKPHPAGTSGQPNGGGGTQGSTPPASHVPPPGGLRTVPPAAGGGGNTQVVKPVRPIANPPRKLLTPNAPGAASPAGSGAGTAAGKTTGTTPVTGAARPGTRTLVHAPAKVRPVPKTPPATPPAPSPGASGH